MSIVIDIQLYCEECGHKVDPDYIICTDCYNEIKKDCDQLQDDLDDANSLIKELEDQPR